MLMKPILKLILLIAAAVVLSITTVVFGALPMRAMRRVYGRTIYWGSLLAVSLLIIALFSPSYGLLVLTLAVAMGAYSEIEELGGSIFISGFAGALAGIGMTFLGVAIWVHRSSLPLIDVLREKLVPVVERLSNMNGGSSVTVEMALQQLPSGLVIGLLTAMAVSLIGENRVLHWVGYDSKRELERPQAGRSLGTYRVPDVFIWLAIAAIFGAFFKHGNALVESISVNALNVLVVVFFFQGLAVVSHLFRTYRVSPFWQGLWYLVLVVQLFPVVSLVGFVDFWIEFRERLTRKPAENKKGI